MRSHLPAALCSLALFAPATYAAPLQYMVDFSGTREFTYVLGGHVITEVHTVRVHGTIDAETTTGELMTSNLLFTHSVFASGNDVPLPALPQVVNGSPSQYHWLATSSELRFFSDVPYLAWQVSEPQSPYGFQFVNQYSIGPAASGFLSQRLYYESGTDIEDISAQSPATSGILVGTAVVPEPASYAMAILGLATVGAIRRRSRSAV